MVLRILSAATLLISLTSSAQSPATSSQTPPTPPATQTASANELVKTTVQNELKAINSDRTHWMYQMETHKGVSETRDVVETPHGNIIRVVARNGRPLTPDEQKQEDEKVQKFVSDTSAQQKQQRDAGQDEKQTKDLLALLPDALTYTDAGHDGDNVKLTFQPNPSFHPPSREARVFHSMEGELIIDEKEHRLVQFSGHLTHPVKFGAGLLGDLQQGGTFDIRQQPVGSGHWDISVLKVDIKGKALFFKTINVQQNETHSHFKRVPDDLTLAQAEDLTKKPQPPAESPQSGR